MMNMTAKVAFELTKDGKVTIEVIGSEEEVKAGLLTIIKTLAAADGSTTSELLAELFEISKMKEDFEKMPEEMKEFLDKMFGGLS